MYNVLISVFVIAETVTKQETKHTKHKIKHKFQQEVLNVKTTIYTITYNERRMIDRFTCVDTQRTIKLRSIWSVGGLLYGYVDRFNVKAIDKDSIVEMTVKTI